jgi:hypothetical protein
VYPAIRMLASASATASTAPAWSAALFMGGYRAVPGSWVAV